MKGGDLLIHRARYFLLHLQGKAFQIISTHGGLLESPRTVTEVLITPGERLDIAAGPFDDGETFLIESLPYNRMTSKKPKQETFAEVKVGPAAQSIATIPSHLRHIEPLAAQDAEVNRKTKFSVEPSLKNGFKCISNTIHIIIKILFKFFPIIFSFKFIII